MRKTATTIFTSAIITLFLSTQAFAQQTLPDYTKWDKIVDTSNPAVHNGKDIFLHVESYQNLDVDNLYYHTVVVIYDEQKRPWIFLYIRILLYRDGDKLVSAGVDNWLFEDSGKGPSFVKDFSQSKDLQKETADFLKSQYGLELK